MSKYRLGIAIGSLILGVSSAAAKNFLRDPSFEEPASATRWQSSDDRDIGRQ